MVILAKALFKFEGTQSDDLSFEEDDVITVLEKDDSGWWTGRNEAGKTGEFPFNYVEVMDEAATQAYIKKQGSGSDAGGVGFVGDHVDTVELKAHSMGPKGGQVTIESSLNNGTRETVTKSLVELRAFDAQLRNVIPDFDAKLPPAWGDRALLSETMLERRKDALDTYLQKLIAADGADFLLVPFFFPGRKAQLSETGFAAAARAQANAKAAAAQRKPEAAPTLARAEYSWEPTDAVELRLEAGDVVAVLSQQTGSDGWWDGQTADGSRGLFPYNHIEVLSASLGALYMEGKPLPASTAAAPVSASTKKKEHKILPLEGRQLKITPNFVVGSTQAFDDMLDKGIAIENVSGGSPGVFPRPGDEVVIKFRAYLWDCQLGGIAEFLSSDDKDEGPMEFILDNDPNIVKGLHLGVQRVPVGASARIIVAPKNGYGVAGFPPAIPPLATLVYDVTILSSGPPKVAPGTPRQKPEVKARMQDSAPRVLSMKLMAPLLNREAKPTGKGAEPAAAPAAPAAIVTGASTKEHAPARRAGHVVASSAPAPGAAAAAPPPAAPAPAPAAAKPKYELAELQEIVKTSKADELGLDRATLEDYLTDKAFFEAFLLDRGHFLLKPLWRQQALKRAVGLF